MEVVEVQDREMELSGSPEALAAVECIRCENRNRRLARSCLCLCLPAWPPMLFHLRSDLPIGQTAPAPSLCSMRHRALAGFSHVQWGAAAAAACQAVFVWSLVVRQALHCTAALGAKARSSTAPHLPKRVLYLHLHLQLPLPSVLHHSTTPPASLPPDLPCSRRPPPRAFLSCAGSCCHASPTELPLLAL